MPEKTKSNQLPGLIVKFVGGAVGLIFAGIGIAVLFFMWAMPFGEFGSPPLFFRIFASLISMMFVVIGGAVSLGSIFASKKGGLPQSINQFDEQQQTSAEQSELKSPPIYTCTRCGAPLGEGVQVSPHGDVKCAYCSAWFNIYGK